MKLIFSGLFCCLGFANLASAAIVFTLTPNGQAATAGTMMSFSVRMSSTVGAGETVDAFDFNAIAGAGNGADGVFDVSSNTTLLNNAPLDFAIPGQAYASNFLNGGTLIPFAANPNLPGAGVLAANLFLDTTGVATGIYTMSMDSLAANAPGMGGGALAVSGNSINYEIIAAAVPEPTSILTAASLGFGAMFYRRRRVALS